jgi:hypothetical protein
MVRQWQVTCSGTIVKIYNNIDISLIPLIKKEGTKNKQYPQQQKKQDTRTEQQQLKVAH